MNTSNQARSEDNRVDTILIKFFLDNIVNRIDWNQFQNNTESGTSFCKQGQLIISLLIFVNVALVLLILSSTCTGKYGRKARQREGYATASTGARGEKSQGQSVTLTHYQRHNHGSVINNNNNDQRDCNDTSAEATIEGQWDDTDGGWGSEFDYDSIASSELPEPVV